MARCFSTHVNQLSIPETMKQNLLGMGIQKLFDIQVPFRALKTPQKPSRSLSKPPQGPLEASFTLGEGLRADLTWPQLRGPLEDGLGEDGGLSAAAAGTHAAGEDDEAALAGDPGAYQGALQTGGVSLQWR